MKTLANNKKLVRMIVSAMMVLVLACGILAGTQMLGSKASAVRSDKATVVKDYWNYYNDGEIRFTANITKIAEGTPAPWEGYADKITCVTIDRDNVREIGANGFSLLKVAAVYIPVTVEKIDSNAFANSSIKTVYYEGSKTSWESMFSNTDSGITINYNHSHTDGEVKHAIASTCTAKGYEGDIYCSKCAAFYKNGKTLNYAEHVWSTDYAVEVEPTCNTDGLEAHYCTVCLDTFSSADSRVISKTGDHNWVVREGDKFDDCKSHITKNILGTEDHIVMHCDNDKCNAVSTDPEFQVLEIKYDEKNQPINAKQVQYNKDLKEKCSVKADKAGNPIHIYSYETKEATCTEPGKTVVTCEFCKAYTKPIDIPARGHSDVYLNDVTEYVNDSTCTETGEKGTLCSVCGEILSSEVIPTKHTKGFYSGTWITITEPTCVSDGKQFLECNYCKEYITETKADGTSDYVSKVLDKTPDVHGNSRWFTILEPTCTEKGEEIQICTNDGCQYYSNTKIGATVIKASDRKALEAMIAVTKDNNQDNYFYGESGLTVDERVYDVADEINMAILAAYKAGKEPDADALAKIFETALNYHGKTVFDKKTLKNKFVFDKDVYEVDIDNNPVTTCVEEESKDRFVYSEIVKLAVEKIIEKESVINTTDDIVAILEEAFAELGTNAIKEAIDANPEDKAKLINKSLAKKEIEAYGHNFVRTPYIVENNKFVPVVEKEAGSGKWYKVASYEYNKDTDEYIAVAGDELVDGQAVTNVNCLDGGGNMIFQCTRCLELDDPTLVKKGSHDIKTRKIAATCESNGYDETYCSICDYSVVVFNDVALGHNHQETLIKDSTCSKAGIKVKICTQCGDVDKATYQTLQTIPHTDVNVEEAATCSEGGRKGVVCSVCGRFSGEKYDALGHNYVEETVKPTCEELGYTIAKCTRCGDTKDPEKYVAVAGHQWSKAVNVAATCEKASYTMKKCKVCGKEDITNEGAINAALGHDIITQPAVAPTCTATGLSEGKHCSRCDYTISVQKEVAALGHKTENVAAKAPTCTAAGYEAYIVCKVCGVETKEKVAIPATGHNYVTTEAKAATCTEDGYTQGMACSKCGDVKTATQVVPATGHEFDKGTITKEATAFKNGEKVFKCTHAGCTESYTAAYKLTFLQKIVWFFNWIFTALNKALVSIVGQ